MFRKDLIRSKAGELTTQQIVGITIIIISFVVILYFLFILNPAETNTKQICRNSVVLTDKGNGLVGSLDCKTSYQTIASTTKNETMAALTNELSDCWWMFGEGKIDYMDASFLGGEVCAICSIVKFEEDTPKEVPTISYQELYDYMRTTQKSQSESYLQYIYSVSDLNTIQDFAISNYLSRNIDTTKEYFILTGISKKPVWRWFTITGVNPIPVYILEKTPENYAAVGCDEYITKA